MKIIKRILLELFIALACAILLVPVCAVACWNVAKELPIKLSELLNEYLDQ
jgi:hypothetical protein